MAKRDDTGVLARWSRRKAAARKKELEPEAEVAAGAPPAQQGAAATAPADISVREEPVPDLPDPDTLDASADFKAYLKPGVPPELKTRALRRLWRIDPFYSRHDGLDDCCGDFTDQARVVKNLKTIYRVGRGMIERVTEQADAGPPASTPAARAETRPRVVDADEPQQQEKLPVDHETVSDASASAPAAGQAPAEPPKRAAAKPYGNPRRLPRRG